MCLGSAFAVQEATLVVAALMRNFVLDLVPGQSVWPDIDFTMRPRDGLRMTVKPGGGRRRSCAQPNSAAAAGDASCESHA